MARILFVGPIPPPITGQSFAFSQVWQHYQKQKKGYLIDTNFEQKSPLVKLVLILWAILHFFFTVLFRKFDVLYFTCTRSFLGSFKDIMFINLAKLFSLKVVNHLHGADFKDFVDSLPSLYKKILINAYKKVDVSIVLLEEMKDQFQDFTDTMEVKVVSNFYDTVLDEITAPQGKHDQINISFFSNVMYSKGILETLEAFEALSKKHDNIFLHIAGNIFTDSYMTNTEIQQKLDLFLEKHPNAKYYGVVKKQSKKDFLENTDVFLLPSFYKSEAFPITIIEAMRAGAIVITTDHNYLKYIVSKESGSIVPPRSAEALEKELEKYILDENLRAQVQEYNLNYAQSKYSLQAHIDKLDSIINV